MQTGATGCRILLDCSAGGELLRVIKEVSSRIDAEYERVVDELVHTVRDGAQRVDRDHLVEFLRMAGRGERLMRDAMERRDRQLGQDVVITSPIPCRVDGVGTAGTAGTDGRIVTINLVEKTVTVEYSVQGRRVRLQGVEIRSLHIRGPCDQQGGGVAPTKADAGRADGVEGVDFITICE